MADLSATAPGRGTPPKQVACLSTTVSRLSTL